MRKKTVDHLAAIIISSILEHGSTYMRHIPEMIKHWEGPLDEDNIFLHRGLIRNFGKKNAEKIMGKLKDLNIHSLFNRDFFQGIIDGLGYESNLTRIIFYGRSGLREFLESSEHNFNVKFGKYKNKLRNQTTTLKFLSLQIRGELDKYFAGVLSSSVPFINEKGEVFCSVSKKCGQNLKKLGIYYREYEKNIIISPFYLFIFSGDLPEPIYREWLSLLDSPEFLKMESASIDALMNWRFVFGSKVFKAGDLPYLQSRSYYYNSLGIKLEDLSKFLSEKQFDFVDERVRNRVKRWYNISVPQTGPISSPK